MKLINNSPRNYIAFDTVLEAGKILEIKDTKTVNILKTQPGVEEYIDKEEVEALKKQVEELKKDAKKVEKLVKETKKTTKK
jgi:hypothetical protein